MGLQSAIQGKVTAFNDLYNKFEIWLGSRGKENTKPKQEPVEKWTCKRAGDDRYV